MVIVSVLAAGGIFLIAWSFGFKHGARTQRDLWSQDCFYCHECVLCKKDPDASYCRSRNVYCAKCASTVPHGNRKA